MITREEQYLNRLAGETEQAIPEPETRKEQYLSRLCGADNIIPQNPITREEQYLASLCGEEVEMPDPETRLEQFMAFAGGERESKPEPITRKEQLWDKYQGGGVIEDKTVTGEVISVSDAIEAPAVKLKVTIEPKQDGSGDPSPENIRPITGWTGASLNTAGEDYADTAENGWITTTGDDSSSDGRRTQYIPVVEGDVLRINWTNQTPASRYARLAYYNANKEFLSLGYNSTTSGNRTAAITRTVPEGVAFARFAANDRCTINYVYKNRKITEIPFTRTVYGGTVDLVTGELVVNRGYIASYNGESLPGVWISDRDVYSEGTTPSIGAQVVYELATPQTYTLTPQQIQMLEGNNTVWVNLINEDTTTQTATSELTYKSRAAQRVLAMNGKLNLNKQALEIKRNGGVVIDKPIIKPIDKGGLKL